MWASKVTCSPAAPSPWISLFALMLHQLGSLHMETLTTSNKLLQNSILFFSIRPILIFLEIKSFEFFFLISICFTQESNVKLSEVWMECRCYQAKNHWSATETCTWWRFLLIYRAKIELNVLNSGCLGLQLCSDCLKEPFMQHHLNPPLNKHWKSLPDSPTIILYFV